MPPNHAESVDVTGVVFKRYVEPALAASFWVRIIPTPDRHLRCGSCPLSGSGPGHLKVLSAFVPVTDLVAGGWLTDVASPVMEMDRASG